MAVWPTIRHKKIIFKHLSYDPNEAQWPIHKSKARIVQIVGGERAGKSTVSGNEVAARILSCQRIAFVADDYTHSRKEFDYLTQDLDQLGLLRDMSTPKRGAWVGTTTTGCLYETVSVNQGIQQLTGKGEPYDIVVVCEAGLQQYNTLLAARGRVSETRGLILLSGTLWDNIGWYADMYRLGQKTNEMGVESFSLPTWSNKRLFPGGKDDPEIALWRAALNDPNEAARRIDAVVMPSPARMFPEFSELVHVKQWCTFDPYDDVILFVDSGYFPSRYAVLAVQFRKDNYGREILCIIDEIWEHHKMHEEIIKIAQGREWMENVTTIIGGHETKQHNAAESTADIWSALSGLYMQTFNAGRVLEGARRVRYLLNSTNGLPPRIYLSPKCTGTSWEFQRYSRMQDRSGAVISEEPQDKNNDAMDALRNGVVWRYGMFDVPDQLKGQVLDMTNPFDLS